jgi:hypothetical protein
MIYKPGYSSFCSVLWLADDTTSRTCVFFRGNVPPTILCEDDKKAIAEAMKAVWQERTNTSKNIKRNEQ